jgi:hypothetical protein
MANTPTARAALSTSLRYRLVVTLLAAMALLGLTYHGKPSLDNDERRSSVLVGRGAHPVLSRRVLRHEPSSVAGATDCSPSPVVLGPTWEPGKPKPWEATRCDSLATGPTRVVDSRGVSCHVTNVLESGCCDGDIETNITLACLVKEILPGTAGGHDSLCLQDSSCCNDLALCIGCCIAKNRGQARTDGSGDLWPACQARCRHNSKSTYHQNQYATPFHHCFQV